MISLYKRTQTSPTRRTYRAPLALVAFLVISALLLTACGQGSGQAKAAGKTNSKAELVIYSGRKEALVAPVLEAFTAKTGIKTVLKAAGATELASLIMEEQRSPRADIYLSNDAGALEKLRAEGVLEPYTSVALQNVPDDLKAPDNTWHAVTARARVIMYNKDSVAEVELPSRLADLADPKWRGQIGMATGANESVIANVTALRLSEGEAAAEAFLRGLVANDIKVYKGHGDVRQAVGRGEIKLGWVNHYYYHQQLHELADNNVGVIYPDQDGAGTVVNISGVAIVKGARHLTEAQQFLDYLLTPEAQEIFAGTNYEIPVLPGVPVNEAKSLDAFRRNPVQLGQFGSEWDASVRLIDRIGLVLK